MKIRSTDTSRCKDLGLPSIGEDPVLVTVPKKQSSVKQVAVPELNNDSPSMSRNWNEEDIDAPTSEFGNIPLTKYILDSY